MIRPVIAAVVLVVALACDPPVTSGVVTSREHQPAYVVYSTTCYSYDKNGSCSLSLPSSTYYPDQWDLCLRADAVNKPAGQQPTGCVEVAESEWATYHVGDHFPRPK